MKGGGRCQITRTFIQTRMDTNASLRTTPVGREDAAEMGASILSMSYWY